MFGSRRGQPQPPEDNRDPALSEEERLAGLAQGAGQQAGAQQGPAAGPQGQPGPENMAVRATTAGISRNNEILMAEDLRHAKAIRIVSATVAAAGVSVFALLLLSATHDKEKTPSALTTTTQPSAPSTAKNGATTTAGVSAPARPSQSQASAPASTGTTQAAAPPPQRIPPPDTGPAFQPLVRQIFKDIQLPSRVNEDLRDGESGPTTDAMTCLALTLAGVDVSQLPVTNTPYGYGPAFTTQEKAVLEEEVKHPLPQLKDAKGKPAEGIVATHAGVDITVHEGRVVAVGEPKGICPQGVEVL